MSSSPASSPSDSSRPWWQRWWVVLLILPALALGIVGGMLFFLLFAGVPLPEDLGVGATVVLDRDGNEVGTLTAEAAREDVTLEELPEHVPQAVMAAEDRSFYEHSGISATGILRALFENARAGEVTQGGSTITQQYIKNAALTAERTFTRKMKEASLAIKLEREFTKDEILGFYLSSIYWGRGAYGIEAAAETYFDRSAAELDINQAATLAGIIQAPERLDPIEAPGRADQRRIYTLDGMLQEGWIDQATHDELVAAGLPQVSDRQQVASGPNAYYLDAVQRELAAELGEAQLFTGLTVHTELDARMQEAAQTVVAEAVAEGEFDSGALVSIDPVTGGVRALVGGPDFGQQQFNVAVRGARQVGSSFKPFTLAAFAESGYSPESRFPAPATYRVEGTDYEANNYGGQDFGEQSVYQATATSTNTVFVQMQQLVGGQDVIESAVAAGLPEQRGEEPAMEAVPSLTLGSFNFTPLEMAAAYGTYANQGVRTTPRLVSRVERGDGSVVYEPDVSQQEAVAANDAAIVTRAMQGVISGGTGTAADIGRPAAGKTGTTQNNRDAWFVGYVPQLVTAVWVGSLQETEIEGLTGGSSAAPIWGRFMAIATEGMEVQEFPAPDLSGYEVLNDEPEPCPEGYERRAAPTEEPAEGEPAPDVIDDGEEQPCVEIAPSPSPSPSPSASPSPSPTLVPSESPTLPLPGESETQSEPSPSPTEDEPSPSPSPTDDGGG